MLDGKLGHDTTAQRMCAQPLNLDHDLSGNHFPHIRLAFFGVIGLQVLKVFDR